MSAAPLSGPPRSDLLHLSPEALAQTVNVGVVKRAVRELEGGYRPALTVDEDGGLTARFSDGLVCSWPPATSIQHARCTCGAATVCRHRIIAALAYRETVPVEGAAPVRSPGEASDEDLSRTIPASLLQAATMMRERGLSIDVCRGSSTEPCDTARLPSATVRYWAGAHIEAARCDCLRASACEHVALGVWAFREADRAAARQPVHQVRLGHVGSVLALDALPYVQLMEAVLRHGVSQGAAPLTQPLSTAMEAARHTGAVWIGRLLADVEGWASAYAARSALYAPEHGVSLLAELALRLAGGVQLGQALTVLGIGQAQETELDRLRLMCLGARTERDGEQRRTRLVMADMDTGTSMVLSHEWKVADTQLGDEATLRSSERLAPGVRLTQLAQGQVLAQQARRLADGSLRLAKARTAQNSVLPQAADWSLLKAPLRFDSVAQLAEHQRAHPVAAMQARHAARQFVVFSPSAVDDVVYDPNDQAVLGVLSDGEGDQLVLRRSHEPHTRHALDAMAGALNGTLGPLRHVAGLLHWVRGSPQLEPWAFAC
ncbi:MAG: hypothetical protein RLZZ618_469, partial [Pseudomonadota bacterium]